jgi:hypothetical protein
MPSYLARSVILLALVFDKILLLRPEFLVQ